MKKVFAVDWLLLCAFVFLACSGFGLHLAGHGADYGVWYNWAVFHAVASLSFFVAAIFHIQTHWGWYNGIFKRGIGKRSKNAVALSAVFICTAVSGAVVLAATEGAGSPVGLWHYKMAILMCLLSLWHILKRFSLLLKSLKDK